jgi:acyl carrier protein
MSSDNRALLEELKQFVVRRLRLEQTDAASIDDDALLVGGGLDLDSIDLLELVVGLEREYGIRIADVAEGRRALASLPSLAAYVTAHRAVRDA